MRQLCALVLCNTSCSTSGQSDSHLNAWRLRPVFVTRVFCAFIFVAHQLSVFAGKVTRSDMMIVLETFRARAKSMLDWEFDIIKETANVVDFKLRAAQPSRVVLCGVSQILNRDNYHLAFSFTERIGFTNFCTSAQKSVTILRIR